ncbi:unnamed protein product [Rotaria sp. Silwood1]|nr:unnamed protein product [Rotaria sp. Silwood1]CAF0746390.1 unnamed protein product [Rotaria sp. Silwood1]CAF3335414.1 unnamed protein product [Rotaria sp. Silwood1]CAF3360952.1 unnamed protein product [Rotaria sp. Silwood1]CAF4539979.1 unnamed protein product [Rotaria sp. Silwood1]
MVAENSVVPIDNPAPPRLIPSTRFTLALLVFFAFVVQYSQRVNLPIGIVCMVNRTKPIHHNTLFHVTTELPNDISIDYLNSSITTSPTSINKEKGGFFNEKQFHWPELQQQLLLGGYWAGYIFTQIPGGWLATSIGAKWVYAGSLGTSSLATLAITWMYMMSSTHFFLILMLRFIIGLAHGVLFPATISLWSVWAVPQERSTLASIGFCGTHLGTSLTVLVGGVFCRYLFAGWMYLFFITSILGFIWLALWTTLTANAPHHHKKISDHERDYISSLTGSTGHKRPMSLASIPWKNIIKSKPLVALILTQNANLFGLFFFLTNLAKVLNELLNITPANTGYILSFGYFLTLLSSLLSGIAVDHVVRKNVVTLTTARKISNSLTSFIPVFCMVLLYFSDNSSHRVGVFAVLLFLAASGLGYGSGYVVNFADIVPAYSGVIFGLANTFASLAGVIGNLVAGIIVKKPVLEQWRKLYIIFGIVYFFGGLVYVLYGSAVPRKWAKFQTVNNDAKLEKKTNDEIAMPMDEKV